jgi:ABC-type Zn uptake system ZnuABC Zn-binding protein ZnuA
VEVSESACDEQLEEPDADGNVDPHCWLKARNAFAEVRALPGVSVSPV